MRQPDGFQRLRGGMYIENEGTWFSMRYILTPPWYADKLAAAMR